MIENKSFHEIVCILLLISWLIVILCTSTVLFIILRCWHPHCRSVINLHVCNSCFSLFFFAITYSIQIPSFIQQIYINGSPPNTLFCQITACLSVFSTGLVAHSCIAQAISQFFITVLYKHKYLLTFRITWIIIIISWLINVIIAVGMFISPYAYQYDSESHFCTLTAHHFPTAISIGILFAFGPMLMLMILYVIILRYTIYQTRINPNSQSTLRVRRSKRVFQNIILTFNLYSIAGIPYILCLIMNRINEAPWQLYSIQVLAFSFTAAIHSIFIFIMNKKVKEILFAKLTGQPIVAKGTRRQNQVVPNAVCYTHRIHSLKTVT
ncbi:hypothetical protein I4U23_022501 [Adineta vaga]|nr:hypothetical protein I4U23_022501 [Adineta vaga]